uniref:Uncharacterized protein n=1 Tax=Tanacetum cinerariifolium TaxID=118510 RepID=A0A6L2JRU0_TANCI|nr:hypothetical protein [Tanacetum cinerariifolium]
MRSEGTSIYLQLLVGRRKECIKVGPIVSFNPELWLADSLSKITEKDCKKGTFFGAVFYGISHILKLQTV